MSVSLAPSSRQTNSTTARRGRLLIDLIDPAAACVELQIDEPELLELVNGARLAAYELGGEIRFRACDVTALARRLTSAA